MGFFLTKRSIKSKVSVEINMVPSIIQIATVSGICNYRCIMCPIEDSPTEEIMSNDRFRQIIERFIPYQAKQEYLSFCGLGEPTLDPHLPGKVKMAKDMGFKGVSVYTNGQLLRRTADQLISAMLDNLIVSIDGITPETQSAIRVHSNLGKVVEGTEYFLQARNTLNSRTKIIVRFTRQEKNQHEEEAFVNFWRKRISPERGDSISVYNVHNVGVLVNIGKTPANLPTRCSEVYERVMVGSDGEMIFCCGDQTKNRKIRVGNVLDSDPVQLYNSPAHQKYREMMEMGKIAELELCKNCSVAYSIATREIGKR
jgi:sulfatase maturation enzyme AslB (radical SAM superfamily)